MVGAPCENQIVQDHRCHFGYRVVGGKVGKPEQALRSEAVSIKLNPIRSVVRGKRIVLIDDSIVRGTTIARIIGLLRGYGAKEVHVRISAPPFRYPCFFGTDVPSSEDLIANTQSIDGITRLIGADSLGYLDISKLSGMLGEGRCDYCDACFSGKYPEGSLDYSKETEIS